MLKHWDSVGRLAQEFAGCSIHPQGWVLVETASSNARGLAVDFCSIHPQGWVLVETIPCGCKSRRASQAVAFTPKGGCPLKRPEGNLRIRKCHGYPRSIHPQGWVCGGRMVVATHSASRARHAVPYNAMPLPPRVGVWRTHGCGDAQRKQGTACRAPTTQRHSPQGWVLVGVRWGGGANRRSPLQEVGVGRRGRTAVRPYKRSGWDGRANRRSPLQGCIHHRRGRVGADCPPLL